jgi:TPR repeat protein
MRDPAEAFVWYLKAAAADDAEAHFRLGNLYDQGIGAPADPVKSRDHYARAVDLGHAGAKEHMARLVGRGFAAPDFGNPFKGLR